MSAKSVLILEDAIFIREIEKRYLKNNGYDIIGETNSEDEGVKIFRESKPALVVLDLHLAQGTGIDAARRMKEINPEARVVVVTSYDEELSEHPDLKAWFAVVLTKPFTEEEFVKALQGAF